MKVYSYDEIFDAVQYMARIVTLYGDRFLPIFERLQEELKKAEQRKISLDLAKQIAKGNL